MGLVVHLRQVLKVEVGVDLGGGEAGVAEQFLHRAQVAGGFEQMGGEGVAQQVGVNPAGGAAALAVVGEALLSCALNNV